MPLCSNCGKENKEGSRFCQSCGNPLSAPPPRKKKQTESTGLACGSCGTINAPGMKFCKMCGSPLGARQGQPAKVACHSCGGQTPAGYKFCQHCGTPLTKSAQATGTMTPAPKASAPAPEPAAPVLEPSTQFMVPPTAPDPPAEAPPASAPEPAPAPAPPAAPDAPLEEQVAQSSGQLTPLLVAGSTAPTIVPQSMAPSFEDPLPARVTSEAMTLMDAGGLEGTPLEPEPPPPPPEPEPPPAPEPELEPPPPPPELEPPPPPPELEPPPPPPELEPPPPAPEPEFEPPPPPPLIKGKTTVGPGSEVKSASVPAPAPAQPMARLVSINRDGSRGKVHQITEEAFDIGRTAGQLTFKDDPYLSQRHCRFSIQNDQWVVQDLQSKNGVYYRVQSVQLEDGDQLLLGKEVLIYEVLSKMERNLAPAVEHGVLIFGSPLRNPWGRMRQATVAGIHRDIYHLHRPTIMIGREEGDLLFTDDEFMSRSHLLITRNGDAVMAQDQGSSNGTFLRIRLQRPVATGAMIRVGDQLLCFENV